MNTPIADFVRGYEKQNKTRVHMPGHKGKSFLGCEGYDITEIKGADSLYEAYGIIAESEKNAAKLFGTAKTIYSTEGSSQCIRAMLYLALTNRKRDSKPTVLATRNAHKTFLYAAALLDIEVVWIHPKDDSKSLCSCNVSADDILEVLKSLDEPPLAVYVTSPDYLGGQLDIKTIADICHKYDTILAVDNAHGAYLRFLGLSKHPMDLGADICCDSAHKTLPVLTGGAYLHISKKAPLKFAKEAKRAMELFGSTSPSYLILTSLDICNQYLSNGYREKLADTISRIEVLRYNLQKNGWKLEGTEPLKITVCMPDDLSGIDMAEILRNNNVEIEYADPEYVVCMITPENTEEDFERLLNAFGVNTKKYAKKNSPKIIKCRQAISIRDAIFAEHEVISVSDSLGRICAAPMVSCPPAIPIVASGEIIKEDTIKMFLHYGIDTVDVVKE